MNHSQPSGEPDIGLIFCATHEKLREELYHEKNLIKLFQRNLWCVKICLRKTFNFKLNKIFYTSIRPHHKCFT